MHIPLIASRVLIDPLYYPGFAYSAVYKTEYLPRFCKDLGMPAEALTAAHEMFEAMKRLDVCSTRASLSQCAATLYFLSHLYGMPITLSDVAALTTVGDSTIKDTYKEMFAHRREIFPISSGLPLTSLALLPSHS